MKNINIKLFSLLLLITMIIPLALIGCDDSGQTSESTTNAQNSETSLTTTIEETSTQETTNEQATTGEEITTMQSTTTNEESDIEMLIKQSYLEYRLEKFKDSNTTIDQIPISVNFGMFNNCIIVIFGQGVAQISTNEIVADITIYYSDANMIYAYNAGKIYRLQEAYDIGLLSKEDIQNIANLKNQ